MPFQGGPYVQTACLCENMIEDRQGVLSLIRIIDTVTTTAQGKNPPLEMPTVRHHLKLVLMLKSGEAQGRETINLVTELPTKELRPLQSFTIHFEGGEKGHNYVLDLFFEFEYEGIYWFKAYIAEELLTAIPLRVKYDRIVVGF